jgi:hypothetical protein
MSFADEGVKEEPDSPETALFRGRQVNQCPAGTSNESGICTPNPKSEASVESRVAASTRNGQQWESKVKSPMERQRDSLKRELPKAKQDLTQVRKLTKEGVKSRIGQ